MPGAEFGGALATANFREMPFGTYSGAQDFGVESDLKTGYEFSTIVSDTAVLERIAAMIHR